MPTEPELLQAVLAKPDDDAPRLEYAKWCEAQVDRPTHVRAEFIRGQIAISHRAETDPAADLRQLKERSYELRRTHATAWTRTLGRDGAAAEFWRGFPECVQLDAGRLGNALAELRRAAPIRHLDLSGTPETVGAVFASSVIAGVRSIRADGLALGDAVVARLAENPAAQSLRWLSLTNTGLGLDGARALVASPFLRGLVYVNLFGNPVDPVDRFGLEDENVVGAWQPPEGKLLENWHGVVPWLHRTAKTVPELTPNRFRLR